MKRAPLLLAAACLSATFGVAAARPLDVHVHATARHARVAAYLVRHGLLSPAQAACATLVPGRLGSRRVEHLSVYENVDGRCPGAPQPPTFLFDVYVDTVSGVVDTTNTAHDELDTVL